MYARKLDLAAQPALATTPVAQPARPPLALVRTTPSEQPAPPPESSLRAAATSAVGASAMRGAAGSAELDLWYELAAGRWSVVDQFDHSGRRYLVVRKAPVPELVALSARERQIAEYVARGCANKFVALELGLRESTVATHLKNALQKLGLRSRIELVGLFALVRPARTGAASGDALAAN